MKYNVKYYFSLSDFHYAFGKIYHIVFIKSPKNIGKTYSAVKLCLASWKNGKAFAYVFRYQVEVDCFLNEFKSLLPRNYHIQRGKINVNVYDNDNVLCGIITALSTAHYVKNYDKINLIIFDEFISPVGRYLKNEIKQFYILVSNLIRSKKDWNMYCLGNFHGADNPYFNFFKMYQWKNVNGILTDGNIGYVEIKENAYREVIQSSSANFLTKYDESLAQKYIKGGYTKQDLNMIQQSEVVIMETLYCVVYNDLKVYIHELLNDKLYFSLKGETDVFYALTLEDGLNYNNSRIKGNKMCDLWLRRVLNGDVIFENFTIKNNILEYLQAVYPTYELK